MKRSFIILILSLLLSCSERNDLTHQSHNSESTEDLVVCTRKKYNMPVSTLLVGLEQNLFKKNGINLILNDQFDRGNRLGDEEGVSVAQAFASGETNCDLIGIDLMAFFSAGVSLQDIQPLRFFVYGQGYDTYLVGAKKSGINSIADLKGKVVRAGPDDEPLTVIPLESLLREKGIDLSDVKLDKDTSGMDVADKFRAGTLHASISYNPSILDVLSSGEANILARHVMRDHLLPVYPQAFYGTRTHQYFNKRHLLKKFIKALEESQVFINQNPSHLLSATINHRNLNTDKKIDRDWKQIEKSGDYFGELRLATLESKYFNHKLKRDVSVFEAIEEFQQFLVERKISSARQDLSHWQSHNIAALKKVH